MMPISDYSRRLPDKPCAVQRHYFDIPLTLRGNGDMPAQLGTLNMIRLTPA